MDLNRGNRPSPVNAQQQPGQGHQPSMHNASTNSTTKSKFALDNYKISWIVLLFTGTILVVLTLLLLGIGGKNRSNAEAKYVNTDLKQAVFLNGGQVYFGEITELNSEFIRLTDIYYLRVNQQVQPNQGQQAASQNDISLVKLGCELHGPQDEMLLNREQIIFWENLKTDGQVAEAVRSYEEANPNGQDCAAQSGGTETNNGAGASGTAPAGSEEANQNDTGGTPAPATP